MNSPKVQRSRQVTPCYLKLRWKLPEENTSVKVPMHLWLYCPVTELYTPPSAVARPISTNFPGSIGVCAARGGVARERIAASSYRLCAICWGAFGESYCIQGGKTQRKFARRSLVPCEASLSVPLHTWRGRALRWSVPKG